MVCAMNVYDGNISCTKLVDDINDEAYRTQSEDTQATDDSSVSDYTEDMSKRIL